MTFELLLITMIGLPLQLEGKAASTHQLAKQSYTCTEAELEDLAERWRESYLPAAGALRACGDPAVPGLIEVMTDETVDLNIRLLSARLLAQVGSEEAVIALLDATSNEVLRTSIYQGLRVLNRDSLSVVPLLESALGSEDLSRATAAAKGLARLASAEAIHALLEALREENTQEVAFIGLGEINTNSPVAVNTLITALEDEAEIVRVGAAYGLAEIGPNAEAGIFKLTETLRLRVAGGLILGDESEEVRGMAAYALGEINPLHPEAMKALGITTNLLLPESFDGVLHLRETSEEVQNIASEALDKIEKIYLLLQLYSQDNVWAGVALTHQATTDLIQASHQILSDDDLEPSLRLATVQLVGYYFLINQSEITQDESSRLLNDLLKIVENQRNDFEIRYHAIYFISIFLENSSGSIEISELQRLIKIAKEERTEWKVRRFSVVALYETYKLTSAQQLIEESLIGIFKNSQIYDIWNGDFEVTYDRQLIDSRDIGFTAFEALVKIADWQECSEIPENNACANLRNSISGIFLNQLEASNNELFQFVIQNSDFPNSSIGGLQAGGQELRASVRVRQNNNRPAICRYRVAQRIVLSCR